MAVALRDRDRAKAIIVEIIRQSGGLFRNKTNLFKAFWLAHVEYARTHATGLSRWPIVRMPNGPGIDKIDVLLGDLMTEEMVRVDQVQVGEKSAFEFELIGEPTATFSDEERHAIREAVSLVAGKSAALVSHESHRQSRSWTEAKDGDRLDVFLDVIPDKEFADRSARIGAIADRVKAIAAQARDGGQL
jgi:hypothetical protein